MEVGKPAALSRDICPLFQKPMCEVCQTCALWTTLPVVKVVMIDGKAQNSAPFVDWSCAILNQITVMRNVAAGIDGLTVHLERLNDQAFKENTKNTEAILDVVKHQNAFNGDLLSKVRDAMNRMAGAVGLTLLPSSKSADETKLLNGSKIP